MESGEIMKRSTCNFLTCNICNEFGSFSKKKEQIYEILILIKCSNIFLNRKYSIHFQLIFNC